MTNKMNSKKSDKKLSFVQKHLLPLLTHLKSPTAIGLYLSAIFVYFAFTFYQVQSLNEGQRKPNAIFDAIEWIDLKSQDARFRVRGEKAPEAKIGLLTIDDRSIEEIGRWPWSREKIALVIDRMMSFGAKAIGFDIVFSEPQLDPSFETLSRIESKAGSLPTPLQEIFNAEKQKGQPDKVLAETMGKYSDRLVLGAFNETSRHDYKPYQDYCRNMAFLKANSEKFVKLNATFIVNDEADPFVDLNFDALFEQLFPILQDSATKRALKELFHKDDVSQLNDIEKKQLNYILEDGALTYCDIWLDKEDPLLEASAKIYLQIFEKSPLLKGLPLDQALAVFKSSVKNHPIVQYARWTINTDQLQEPSAYTASFNAEQDSDGTIRKSSMLFRTGNRIGLSFIPSLATQTYLVATGYRADIEINIDPKNPSQKLITKFSIKDSSQEPEVEIGQVPVDEQGRMNINYAGGTNMYPYLPAKELFSDKPTARITQSEWSPDFKRWIPVEREVNKAEFIKDRTFIFGATAIGVYDLRVTPFEKNYPGPETHLNALGNLMQRNFIKVHPKEEKLMLIALAVMGIILSVVMAQAGAILGFLMTAGSGIALFYFDQWIFKKGYIATMALPMILVFSLYLVMTFYKYFTEERKKKQLRSTFSKYVSPSIVDEIMKDPANIELGGRKQKMSVFFSDVRGFTTISEKLEPTVLSDVLNMYLTPMTQIVFANKGTLDKYMGDAVMAFFGAPIYYPDHANCACRCALQSMEKLKDIQKQFAAQNLPMIDIGIGINTSEMSVGNMGSDIVRSYTVMGDAVNLGSRLEGINKEYGTKIIISEFTYEEVKASFTAREIDWVRVKGKNKPVRIYELICEGKPPANIDQMLKSFLSGFQLFHEKKFLESKEQFQHALTAVPDDPVSTLYIERCDDYLAEPPPVDWDGVFVMKTK
jgi:adenylate cyclase